MLVQRIDVSAFDIADIIDVVVYVQRTEIPHRVLIERTKEVYFHDNAAFPCLGDEISQSLEVTFIPFRQIEFITASGVARFAAARPRTDETVGRRGERISGDLEAAGSL